MSTSVRARTSAGAFVQRTPYPVALPGLDVVAAAPELWRVTRLGRVLGYIECSTRGAVERYSARRLIVGTAISTPLGDFARARDALDCFRN